MSGVRTSGVYQPRRPGAAFAEKLADARREVARLLRLATMRGAGLLVLAAGLLVLAALISYDPADASLNNATDRAVTNFLGPVGATAADLLLQFFGIASLAFLAPPIAWGTRAMMGWPLRYAVLRAFAWPFATMSMAAGLGLLPRPEGLPAGAGGTIGIFANLMATRMATAWQMDWVGWALPLFLLVLGVVLAILAADIHIRKVARGGFHVLAFFYWLGSLIHLPEREVRKPVRRVEPKVRRQPVVEEDDEESDVASFDAVPEPVALVSREPRVKREEPKKAVLSPKQRAKQTALNFESGEYELPPLGLLSEPVQRVDQAAFSDESLEENARMLESVLSDFGVKGRIVAVRPGPVVTLYEFEPAAGVKSSRVISLADDVARSMSAVAARIAVIPGRNVLGIELPNQTREMVVLRELLACPEFEKAKNPLILALGKTIGGEPVMADLAKMPHLLIAGTTGSGKSVALNTMILSLLYRLPPDVCRMIMIDPKMLELSVYEGIPHLLAPVVTDPKKAVVALKWAVREMEERYRKMSKLGVRGVEAFNDRVRKAKDKGDVLKRTVQTGFDRETGKPMDDARIEVVLVIDHLHWAGKHAKAALGVHAGDL